jgi:hypothetical protein
MTVLEALIHPPGKVGNSPRRRGRLEESESRIVDPGCPLQNPIIAEGSG